MANVTYEVTGMTCDHCVNAVKGELSQLEGVEAVEVELDSGRVSVTSAEPLDTDTIRSAVERAGYELRV
ncbi:MAG: cation transporter [Actinobacteria bacterium]|nr:cation transporter [Actinomycetota bacterium]